MNEARDATAFSFPAGAPRIDLHVLANLARVGLGGELFDLVDEEGEMLDVC